MGALCALPGNYTPHNTTQHNTEKVSTGKKSRRYNLMACLTLTSAIDELIHSLRLESFPCGRGSWVSAAVPNTARS